MEIDLHIPVVMTYQTVMQELFLRFPQLEGDYRKQFDSIQPLERAADIAFGCVLIPALTAALDAGELNLVLRICSFLEEASMDARADDCMGFMIKQEVGEWLAWTADEERLAPWLGIETKRLCNYVQVLPRPPIQRKLKDYANTWFSRAKFTLLRRPAR